MNKPFFALYENLYLVLKKEYGEKTAVSLFTKIMEAGLKKAYDAIGFEKGDHNSFKEVISSRDRSVGVEVDFPEVSKNRIIYQLHTDPFENLKNIVDYRIISHAYIDFKVRYLLGAAWSYKISKHFWRKDDCIEFIIINNN